MNINSMHDPAVSTNIMPTEATAASVKPRSHKLLEAYNSQGVLIRILDDEKINNDDESIERATVEIQMLASNQKRTPHIPLGMQRPSTLIQKDYALPVFKIVDDKQWGIFLSPDTPTLTSFKQMTISIKTKTLIDNAYKEKLTDPDSIKAHVIKGLSRLDGYEMGRTLTPLNTVQKLFQKIQEMEFRKSGAIPDLETKLHLLQLLEEWKKAGLKEESFNINGFQIFLGTKNYPKFLVEQLVEKFEGYFKQFSNIEAMAAHITYYQTLKSFVANDPIKFCYRPLHLGVKIGMMPINEFFEKTGIQDKSVRDLFFKELKKQVPTLSSENDAVSYKDLLTCCKNLENKQRELDINPKPAGSSLYRESLLYGSRVRSIKINEVLPIPTPENVLGIQFEAGISKSMYEQAILFHEQMKKENGVDLDFFSYNPDGNPRLEGPLSLEQFKKMFAIRSAS